jgi:hypothetical protein
MSENQGAEFDTSRYERSNTEHPEQAYRRGFQQGAHAVVEALKERVDPNTLDALKHYVRITLAEWRNSAKRNRKRHVTVDQPPKLNL